MNSLVDKYKNKRQLDTDDENELKKYISIGLFNYETDVKNNKVYIELSPNYKWLLG